MSIFNNYHFIPHGTTQTLEQLYSTATPEQKALIQMLANGLNASQRFQLFGNSPNTVTTPKAPTIDVENGGYEETVYNADGTTTVTAVPSL